jgi:hypothetical protein
LLEPSRPAALRLPASPAPRLPRWAKPRPACPPFLRSGGVIDKCCDELNHGVLLVGYGRDEKTGDKYYLVKNSWGG